MLHSAVIILNKETIQGKGLFTTQLIRKGALVWELDDPTFTWMEVKAWSEEKLKAFKHYGFQCGIDRYSLPEGRSREMNHSCDPNTWWSGSNSLVARRDIYTNEEITYDYSSCDIDLTFTIECHCNSPSCRRKITNLDYLDSSWQKQYGINLPPHVLSAIKIAYEQNAKLS